MPSSDGRRPPPRPSHHRQRRGRCGDGGGTQRVVLRSHLNVSPSFLALVLTASLPSPLSLGTTRLDDFFLNSGNFLRLHPVQRCVEPLVRFRRRCRASPTLTPPPPTCCPSFFTPPALLLLPSVVCVGTARLTLDAVEDEHVLEEHTRLAGRR